jgi:hypothetical protein
MHKSLLTLLVVLGLFVAASTIGLLGRRQLLGNGVTLSHAGFTNGADGDRYAVFQLTNNTGLAVRLWGYCYWEDTNSTRSRTPNGVQGGKGLLVAARGDATLLLDCATNPPWRIALPYSFQIQKEIQSRVQQIKVIPPSWSAYRIRFAKSMFLEE